MITLYLRLSKMLNVAADKGPPPALPPHTPPHSPPHSPPPLFCGFFYDFETHLTPAFAVARLGQQLDDACAARDAATSQLASAECAAVQLIIVRGALEIDLCVQCRRARAIGLFRNSPCRRSALGQTNEAKRVCLGLRKEVSKLKQQQPLLQEQKQQQQQQQQPSDQLKSPTPVAKAPTPSPSPSAAIAAAVAAATAAASAEHEAVLSHIRSRLSASDALVQASELHAPRDAGHAP